MTALIPDSDWLALYRSLGWDSPDHHMHAAYVEIATEVDRSSRRRRGLVAVR